MTSVHLHLVLLFCERANNYNRRHGNRIWEKMWCKKGKTEKPSAGTSHLRNNKYPVIGSEPRLHIRYFCEALENTLVWVFSRPTKLEPQGVEPGNL